MNILIVDDDVFFQNLISFELQRSGHMVALAEDGKKAMDIVSQNKNLDVIICDINMPVLTGPSFILSLKNFYPHKLPVIIIVSASKDGGDFMNKIEIPHDYYLQKPVDPDELNKILAQLK
jgi:CheY-like chemotaxis protein